MPSADKGFVQAYNAQAGVDVATMMIVESHVSQAANDKQEIAQALESLKGLPEQLGTVDTLLADAGYYSHDNVSSCEKCAIEPFVPPGRDTRNQPLAERFAQPAPLPEDAAPIERMRHKLKTDQGRQVYAQRKCRVEPVFGIIKYVLGFRPMYATASICLQPIQLGLKKSANTSLFSFWACDNPSANDLIHCIDDIFSPFFFRKRQGLLLRYWLGETHWNRACRVLFFPCPYRKAQQFAWDDRFGTCKTRQCQCKGIMAQFFLIISFLISKNLRERPLS